MSLITFTTIEGKTITININHVMGIEMKWLDNGNANVAILLTSDMTLTYEISKSDFDYIEGVIDYNSLDMYRE